ncbi:MAG: hypothetical protein HY586_03460 [Candidatus Omnitrophica bacterium]|nr:hypothetical protein [Candidatus Omnitrophota bacterium]
MEMTKENKHINEEVIREVIIDALDIKFSKNAGLNEKIARLFRDKETEKVSPVEVFAASADDTLLVIKRDHSQKIKHIVFLDAPTQQPFHIRNIRKHRIS